MSANPAPIPRVAPRDAAMPRLISLREVEQLTSLSRSTLYDLIRNQKFPAQTKITERRVAWMQSEVALWIEQKCSEMRSAL